MRFNPNSSWADSQYRKEQYHQLYQRQCIRQELLGRFNQSVEWEDGIGYFPIRFFRDFRLSNQTDPSILFTSSGTGGEKSSQHYVDDVEIYHSSLMAGFKYFYPDLEQCGVKILALLPSYLERSGSSLVYMVQHWMNQFGLPGSGFYLDDFKGLEQSIWKGVSDQVPILIIGVSFALIDFVAQIEKPFPPEIIIMETGGMKGRRKEISRKELHTILKGKSGVTQIHSEYGMTELLSQAYSAGEGRFFTPPWMEVSICDINNPFRKLGFGRTGRIRIIDPANENSCAFILTDDIGRMGGDGSFEVLGRADFAEIRGCSLLYA